MFSSCGPPCDTSTYYGCVLIGVAHDTNAAIVDLGVFRDEGYLLRMFDAEPVGIVPTFSSGGTNRILRIPWVFAFLSQGEYTMSDMAEAFFGRCRE